jgi:hypothetical protein
MSKQTIAAIAKTLRAQALKLPGSEPTHYGMGAKGWVTLRPPANTPLKVLLSVIDESYRAIAPKRVLSQLDSSPRPINR